MKSPLHLFLLPALIAGLNLVPVGRATAQTFTMLHGSNSSDGWVAAANLILSGNILYGTAGYGGSSGLGTVFAVGTDGTDFKTLHTFAGYPSEGATSRAGLILSGNTLYGTTIAGGSSDIGTVFAINTNGTGFTNLHSFSAGPNIGNGYYTNSDGANPWAGLVVSGNTLYGTAVAGGSSGLGTVFAINTDGTGFATLHSFTATSGSGGYYGTNSDGAYPWAGLILSSGTLFGTAEYGGGSGFGTVFAINTDGTGFTTLHSFTTTSDSGAYFGTNNDGAYPYVGLVLAGDTLYGRTPAGGSSGRGTIFAVNTNGTGFANVHSFAYNDDLFPSAGLTLAGNTLYGTTIDYFTDVYYGTVFSLSFRPQLTVTLSGASVILSWPTNVAGFDYNGYTLQCATNLVSPTVWTTNSTAPVAVNGQNTVTTPMAGTRKFYRLSR